MVPLNEHANQRELITVGFMSTTAAWVDHIDVRVLLPCLDAVIRRFCSIAPCFAMKSRAVVTTSSSGPSKSRGNGTKVEVVAYICGLFQGIMASILMKERWVAALRLVMSRNKVCPTSSLLSTRCRLTLRVTSIRSLETLTFGTTRVAVKVLEDI